MNRKNKGNFFTNIKRIYSCYKFSLFELLSVKSKFFEKLLVKIREPYFKREVETVKIKPSNKILHIGCGINPTHCIMISKVVDTKVVGIDNSKLAVNHAKKYLKKNNLDNKIKIEYADGKNYPVKDFDIVFVAINVFPIDGVLDHLSKNLKSKTKILCKSIDDDIPKIIEKNNFSKHFEIFETIKNPKTSSYLIIKK